MSHPLGLESEEEIQLVALASAQMMTGLRNLTLKHRAHRPEAHLVHFHLTCGRRLRPGGVAPLWQLFQVLLNLSSETSQHSQLGFMDLLGLLNLFTQCV